MFIGTTSKLETKLNTAFLFLADLFSNLMILGTAEFVYSQI